MNVKRSTASVAIVFMAMSLFSMTLLQHDAFAQSPRMSVTASASDGSDTITVSGKTFSGNAVITFKVTTPSGGNVVGLDQITSDANGDFETSFKIGPKWSEDGLYKITAKQGILQNSLYTLDVLVKVTDGAAERTFVTESNLDADVIINPEDPNVAIAVGLGLEEAMFVNGADEFTLSGVTDRSNEDITVTITAPNGNIVSFAQITPDLDGTFERVIKVGGPLWKENGFYTVTAKQTIDSKYTDSIQVDILDGTVVPEFGTIAAMILAVAIISIIAISARSRLSIIPRY